MTSGSGRDGPGLEILNRRRRLEDSGRFSLMSFTIKAHGGLFAGSQGLCGEWDEAAPGFAGRDGNPLTLPTLYPNSYWPILDATEYGADWRVVSPTDPIILPANSALTSTQWSGSSCVEMTQSIFRRHLQTVQFVDCPRCLLVDSLIGTLNCLYDATALGCDSPVVNSLIYTPGFIYGPTVGADADLQCLDLIDVLDLGSKSGKGKGRRSSRRLDLVQGDRILRKKKSSKGKSSKGGKSNKKVSACEELGGTCVVYCDVTSDDFECVNGLCDVDIDFGEPVPVLTFDRYYTACSCKIPN